MECILPESSGGLIGNWEYVCCAEKDEIVVEEYRSLDAPIYAVIEKNGEFWITDIFLDKENDLELLVNETNFGLKGYNKAYSLLSIFSQEMSEQLEYVNNIGCSSRVD